MPLSDLLQGAPQTQAEYESAMLARQREDQEAQRAPLPFGARPAQQVARHPDSIRMFDRGNQITVEVPAEHAQDAFDTGRFGFIQGETVPVADEGGQTRRVAPEEVQGALEQGGHVISPHTEWAQGLQHDLGGARGTLEAGLMGAVEGALPSIPGTPLSGGKFVNDLVGLFGGMNADEEFRERREALRELHPTATSIGEIGGMLVPGPGAISHVGNAAEHVAERYLGKGATGLAGIGQKAGVLGARGAIEGALLGPRALTTEAGLGHDVDLNAEHVLASMGEGAALGLLGGALSGAGAGALGMAKSKLGGLMRRAPEVAELAPAGAADIERVAQKQFGFVPEGLGESYVKAASAASGGDAGIIREAGVQNQSAAGREARKLIIGAEEIRTEASRAVKQHVDELLTAARDVTDEARGTLKASYVREAMKDVNPAATGEHAWGAFQNLRDEVRDMASKPREFGLKSSLKSMDELFDIEGQKLAKAVAAGDAAEQFTLLDNVKRAVGKWTKGAQAAERSPDPLRVLQGRATRDRLERLYEGLRTHLEDESLWGKAAADQKVINAAWSRQIDAGQRFERALTTDVGRDPKNAWRTLRGVDPAKADSYVRNLTNPSNDLTHQAVRDYVSSTKELTSTIGRAYDIPAEKAAQVARAGAAADAFQQTITKAEGSLTKANQLEALLKAEKEGSTWSHLGGAALGGLLGEGVGGHAGGAIGGLLGAGLGFAGRLVSKPGHAILQLAQVEKMIGSSEGRVATAVRKLFSRGGEGAGGLFSKGAANGEESFVRGIGKRTAAARKVESRESERARYTKVADALRAAQASPGGLHDGIAHEVEAVRTIAPKMAGAMAQSMGRIAAYLATQVPPGTAQDPMNPGKTLPPSQGQIAKFNRISAVASDPMVAIDHMQHGKLTTEEVGALKACWPRLYEHMQTQVVDHLQSGAKPSYQERTQLGVLFGIPTDRLLVPDVMKSVQAAWLPPPPAGGPKPGGGGTRPAHPKGEMRGAASLQTHTQSMEK